MATQVEALLPSNPLVTQEEHGHASEMLHDEVCSEQGAKQASVDDAVSSSSSKADNPEPEIANKEQTSTQAKEESNSQVKDNNIDQMVSTNQTEDTVKGNPKEFTEAPPPKVNPWTKKMNAVTVVSVNGQAHGLYPPRMLFLSFCTNRDDCDSM